MTTPCIVKSYSLNNVIGVRMMLKRLKHITLDLITLL